MVYCQNLDPLPFVIPMVHKSLCHLKQLFSTSYLLVQVSSTCGFSEHKCDGVGYPMPPLIMSNYRFSLYVDIRIGLKQMYCKYLCPRML